MDNKLSVPLDKFKERELEIINLMAEGLSNKEIADQLFITKETVRWYNKHIYSKLGTSRRTEAIALAREMNLVGDTVSNSTDTQTTRHKLPVTTGPFIGRDDELNELSDLLHDPETRLLSIIAAGGMGKSRLSLELGHLLKGNYEHGVAFIDLTSIHKSDDIAQIVISSLGLSIGDTYSVEEVLFNYCREKELLLIFDNFEDVLAGAYLLTDILEVAPKVTIISTSRERLNLRVETAFYLQPVTEHGIQLFIETATMMHSKVSFREDEQSDIQRIVELVGGSPLGLVLAATWVDTLSVCEIADEIESSLDFLSAELGDIPERQRSIHAVIDPTWKRLSEKEQQAFMWASVFRGGFTREIFQKETGASVRTIQTLLSRSLISHGYGRRYDMHTLLRQYGREKLKSQNMLVEAQHAHLTTFTAYAQVHATRMYDGQHYLESLEALDNEQDNYRSALDWSLNGNYVDTGVTLILSICDLWSIHSQSLEAVYYLEMALLTHKQDAALLYWLGKFHDRLGNTELALSHIKQAVLLAQETNALDILALGYSKLALLLLNSEEKDTLQFRESALAITQELNNPKIIADCHIMLGNTFYVNDKTDESFESIKQAEKIYEEIGDIRGISMTTYNLSLLYESMGQIDKGKHYCEESLKLKRQIGDRAGVARRLAVLAGWDLIEEEFEQALDYVTESIVICEEIGELPRLAYSLYQQGVIRLVMTEFEESQAVMERGLQIANTVRDFTLIESFHAYLALLYMMQGQIQPAIPHIQQAIQAHTQPNVSGWMSIIAYACYLEQLSDPKTLVRMVATMAHHKSSRDSGAKYFLEPLIYRVQQTIDTDVWKEAVDATAEITIEQIFQEIVNSHKFHSG